MAARSIASLSLSFGLVSIPVKLYSATESAATVRFNMLAKDGSRLKQQYVSEKDHKVVERSEMVKGYEFEKDRFVVFEPDELKALQESPSQTIDIVAFIPSAAIDPIFYDKVDDNPPGVMLAYLAATAFVLAFSHPWRTAKKFMFLLLASVLGFILFIILSMISDSIVQNPASSDTLKKLIESPVNEALSIIFAMLCLAAFLVGVVGAIIMFIRNRRQSEKKV